MQVASRLLPGGVASYVFYLLSGLDRARWRPVVCALMEGDCRSAPFEEHGIPVVTLGLTGTSGVATLVRAVRGIGALIRMHRPAVVHTHFPRAGYYGRIAAALWRVPVVVHTVHGMEPTNPGLRRKERRVLKFTDRLIAVSEDTRRHLVSEGFPNQKISVIHSGVPADVFGPNDVLRQEVRRELGVSDDQVLVGCVARVDPEKNIGGLIDAAAIALRSFPGLRFVVAGEGSELDELRRRSDAAGLGGKLTFLGHRNDVPRLLCGMDAFVLPSLREGLGLALVEAMLTEVPVIGTAVGGVPEVIAEGTGLVASSPAAENLAECILRLAEDRELRAELGRAGRERALSEFSSEAFVRRTEELYRDVLERKGCVVNGGKRP